jgi:hypothetical protein
LISSLPAACTAGTAISELIAAPDSAAALDAFKNSRREGAEAG